MRLTLASCASRIRAIAYGINRFHAATLAQILAQVNPVAAETAYLPVKSR
jgi:hypothetical protein